MARKVFFSFHYQRDSWRVAQVRNSNVISTFEKSPFYDAVEWEKIKRQGDKAIENWIETQLKGTSVTVVLVGAETANRRWVKHEIRRSIELNKGLIAVFINGIRDQNENTDVRGSNPVPSRYRSYDWIADNGRVNLGTWIEKAAADAGR